MTDHESEYFIPDKVDEQIDSSLAGEYTVQRSDLLNIQVVQSLQRHYAPVGDESQPLERVWNRLTLHRASLQPSQDEAASRNRLPPHSAAQPQESHRMKITVRNPPPQYTPLRRLSLIAAIVFITLLVGSTFAVFHLTRQGQESGNGHATPTIHPTVKTDEIYAIVNNTIYRYDTTTHRPLWSFKMPVPVNAENIGSRVQVIGGVLYTLGTGSDGYYSYAINTADGSLRWRFKVTYQTFDLSLLGDQLIANGSVYLSEASASQGYTLVTALDASRGTILWQHRYSGTGISNRFHFVDEAAGLFLQAVSSSTLYGTTFTGLGSQVRTTLYAINARNGSVIWQKKVSTDGEMPDEAGGLVINGVLSFSASATSPQPHLFGFDATTGEAKWSVPLDGTTYSFAASDGVVYVGTAHISGSGMDVAATSGSLYAVRAKDGVQLWRYKAQAGVSSPTVQDGTVVVSISRQDYKTPQQNIVALDASKGTVRWSLFAPAPGSFDLAFNPEVIASKNFVYVGIAGKQVRILRLSDGKLVDTFAVQDSLSEGVVMMTVVQ